MAKQREQTPGNNYSSRLINIGFMLIALVSLGFSSWKMQPCSCTQDAIVTQNSLYGGTIKRGRGLSVDTGPIDTTVRKIRLPKNVDRTATSGQYWAHGSWGRVLRTSSGCWAYPAHDAYAIECYERLVAKRTDLFLDVEQLAGLTPQEATLIVDDRTQQTSKPSLTVAIDERLEASKKYTLRGSVGSNNSLPRLPTVYQRYRVPAQACVGAGGTFNFTCIIRINVRYSLAAPDQPPPEVCFMTIGDWGEARKAQREVAAMMTAVSENRMVKFIISTGDNFYPAGVLSTADPQWINTFETPFGAPSLVNIRWFISLGNHDQWGFQAQKAYSEDHPRWYLPDFSYSVSIPLYRDAKKESQESVELAVLNSAGRELAQQVQAADQFFASQEVRHGKQDTSRHWRIVTNHEPILSGGVHGLIPERNEYVRGGIQPSIRQHMVHAYFNGDDHFLEIHRQYGTDYFTSGGGSGSEVYTTTIRPTTKWNMLTDHVIKDGPPMEAVVDGFTKKSSARGAMLHCVEGGVLTTHVIDEKGTVMHVYTTKYDVDPLDFELEIIGE